MNTIAIDPFDQIATEMSIPGHDRGSFKEIESVARKIGEKTSRF